MTSEQLLPYIVGLGGLLLAYLGWRRNDKDDNSASARWMGGIDQLLKEINKKLDNLDGIPGRVKALEDWREMRCREIEREREQREQEHANKIDRL